MRYLIKISEEEYRDHESNGDGLCLNCGEIQYGGCEPDARNYICHECERHEVCGMVEALCGGFISVVEG